MIPPRPITFLGEPIKGSYDRVMKKLEDEERKKREEKANTIQTDVKDNFIYVPSINLYLAKEKTLHGLNWYKTHEELSKQNRTMPTIPQFLEFISYLKNNPNGTTDASKDEIEKILDDILTVRSPWRAERLDAKFKKIKNKFHINYNHRFVNGKLEPLNKELLEECLMEEKTPGIDLDDLLINHTKHGLPNPNIKSGDLYYWHPRENYVAGFYAYSIWSDLNCGRDPSDSDASLGVRCVFGAEGAEKI